MPCVSVELYTLTTALFTPALFIEKTLAVICDVIHEKVRIGASENSFVNGIVIFVTAAFATVAVIFPESITGRGFKLLFSS